MAQITVIQYPGARAEGTLSPPCGKVLMALRVKGLDFRVKNVRSPMEARRFNPRGRVPTLLIDGETIVDSTDIVTALDARFPDPPLTPVDPLEQAQAKLLEDWADEVLYFYLAWLRWGVDANFERMRAVRLSRLPWPTRWILPGIARRIARGRFRAQGVGLKGDDVVRRELAECLDALEVLLRGRSYLVGDRLSRADLAVAAVVDQMDEPRLTPDAAAEVRRRPGIVAWLDRVHETAPCAR
jgi:glutathione S-transferase